MLSKAIQRKAEWLAMNRSTDWQYNHAAILFDKKGHVLATGYNLPTYDCVHACRFGSHRYARFHAETLCLFREFGFNKRRDKDTRELYLLSIRLNRKGKLKLAKPCQTCQRTIERFEIKRVYFSTNDGDIDYYDIS